MSKAPSDPDEGRLHVFEGYRRAKRNILIWSGVTVLIALAGASDGKTGAQFKLPIGGMEHSPRLIALLSLFVLFFLLLTYIRAYRAQLVFRNTEIAYGKTVASVAEEIIERASLVSAENAKSKTAIKLLSEPISNSESQFQNAKKSWEAASKAARGLYALLQTHDKAKEEQFRFWSDVQHSKRADPSKDEASEKVRDQIESKAGEAEALLELSMSDVSDHLSRAQQQLETFERSYQNRLNQIREKKEVKPDPELLALGQDLKRTANRIGFEDRFWSWVLDRGAVWFMIVFAFTAGMMRLCWPELVDQTLISSGFYVEPSDPA